MEQSKLDQFKRLLGGDEVDTTPSSAEGNEPEMAIKLEFQDIESLVTRALVAARAEPPQEAEASAQGGVNAVTTQPLKIASFWEDDPETWFLRLERQFHTRKITSDETKFSHVVQALDKAQTKEVRPLLKNPPSGTS